jgi:hypothetical protein
MSTNDDVWRRPPGEAGTTGAAAPPVPPPARPVHPQPRPEDAVWARPASHGTDAASHGPQAAHGPGTAGAGAAGDAAAGGNAASGTAYSGPPPTNPPPPNWRPPVVAEPIPPGTLPEQDNARIEVEEQAARTLTTGIGLVAGAVLLVLLLILCARAVF